MRGPRRKEKHLDRQTRLKLIARYLSESGELPVGWTEDDERAWSELKARETAPGKVTPSEQEKAEREQCISRFNAAASNEERRDILKDFLEQDFESAIAWPWFKERRDALAQAGLSLYDRQPANIGTAAQPSAVGGTPRGFQGLSQKGMDLSQYFDTADLTKRQRECASMKFEYGLGDTEIARRLSLHHSTVQEAVRAVRTRLQRDQNFERALKKSAAHRGSHGESD